MRDRQEEAVRRALPVDQAALVLAGEDWAVLAATLAEAEQAGHDPTALLADAAGRRELASADSPAAVLTWRVRRDARLPAPAPRGRTAAAASRTTSRATTPPTTAAVPASPGPSSPDTARRGR
ncbi:hypothetical protein ACFQ2M_18240 [Kitasatospora saccharophila]|uniref:hypothetical protein n=1 Tax=Kitasatospora saccharophila TaxID=407973 RepID=UPI003645018A